MSAALKLFAERGFHGVGIEQVAEAAGVARTTVYRRWSSKEALISAAIAQYRGASDENVLKKRVSPATILDEVTGAVVEIFAAPDYQKIIARLVGSVPDYPELMSTYRENYLLPRRRLAAAVLEKARAEGLLSSGAEPEILLDLIAGAIMHYMLVQQGNRSKIKLRDYVLRVLHALGLLDTTDRGAQHIVERKRR
ncbi:MAG TPA: TetR/AcrR family transcriptional regulator [Methylovirgula sp.]|nr:TetR/AcrR family transcriptional regulator [Methylovirgula sp.]